MSKQPSVVAAEAAAAAGSNVGAAGAVAGGVGGRVPAGAVPDDGEDQNPAGQVPAGGGAATGQATKVCPRVCMAELPNPLLKFISTCLTFSSFSS